MKIKTSELSGTALDWAVAMAEGWTAKTEQDAQGEYLWLYKGSRGMNPKHYHPTQWSIGGPIVEREWIELIINTYVFGGEWAAQIADDVPDGYHHATGNTPLIAAMRCYVASKLGDEVEVPDELTQGATA